MPLHVTSDTVNIFFEKYHDNWSKASLCYHAIEHIRESLILLLASRGNAFLCKVDDVFLETRQGFGYRAAYIKSIRVTGITETRNYDTRTLESWKTIKHRKDHFTMWLQVRFMEFYEEIMEPEHVGTEMPPTSLLKQAMFLEEDITEYWDKKSDRTYQRLPLHLPEMMDFYGLDDFDAATSRGLGRKMQMDYRKYRTLKQGSSRQLQPQDRHSYSSALVSPYVPVPVSVPVSKVAPVAPQFEQSEEDTPVVPT